MNYYTHIRAYIEKIISKFYEFLREQHQQTDITIQQFIKEK